MLTYAQQLTLFESYVHNHPFEKAPRNLYEPVDYILSLGGKRVRPVLLLMGYEMFQTPVQEAFQAAMALEVFHNFSLLHDDIMDKAPLRRGKPTVHHKYGLNAGILSGDVMLVLAYQLLHHYHQHPAYTELLALFTRTSIQVCEGQQWDMDFEKKDEVTLEQYLRMIEYKTSVLLACALQMGAMLGGATLSDARHLYEFGRSIGLAFQIKDDLLDAFGDPEKFGKKVGGDIIQGKKTFLYLKALEKASDDTLNRLYHSTDLPEREKVQKVKALFESTGARAATEAAVLEQLQTGLQALEAVQVEEEKKGPLRQFAQKLAKRDR